MEEFKKRLRNVMRGRPYPPGRLPHKPRSNGQDAADFEMSLQPKTDKTIFDVPGTQTHKAWLGIASLWRARWWTRTWIYQEATIPENYTVLFIA